MAVTPIGEAGFNVLREARGYKGSEENKSFSIGVTFEKEVGLKLVAEMQAEADKLHAREMEKAKAAGKPSRFPPAYIRYVEGEDTIKISFKRREADNAPKVLDANNAPYDKLIRTGDKVQIAYTLKPYLLPTGLFGVSHKLEGVKVLGGDLSEEDVANMFGGVTAKVKPVTPAKASNADLF